MTITSVSSDTRDPNLRVISVDGSHVAVVLARDVEALDIRPGGAWTEDLASAIERCASIVDARRAALQLLSRRSWGSVELTRRLVRRDWSRDVADEVVAALVEDGWLDDRAHAAALVTEWLRREGAGERFLAHKLRLKHIDGELASEVVSEALASRSALEDAVAIARRRLARCDGVPEATAQRRVASALRRRGFDAQTVRAALNDAGLAAR